MTGIVWDFRFGVRQLLKRPAWTVAVVSVLGLGIGANTAMFSGFDAWVLRPLDFPAPERLVAVGEAQPSRGRHRLRVSAANFSDWTAQQSSFESLGAFVRHTYNFNDPDEPVRLDGAAVSAPLFPALGKRPVLGRTFAAEDDTPGRPAAVALISDRLWRTRFEADPGVVGRTLRLDGRVHEVVGVMEPGFRFPEWADLWTPLGADPGVDRSNRNLSVIARLREGTSVAAAQQDMARIAQELERIHPRTNEGFGVQIQPLRRYFVPDSVRTALAASVGAGICVLLVICANVASLMLARATARKRETAIRAALGASPGRLVRQSVLEGLLLALPAGVLGAWLGVLSQRAMSAWIPVEPPYLFAMSFDASVGLYTLLMAMLAGVACGLAPVLRGAGRRLTEALREGGTVAGEGRATRWGRKTLVGAELALSTALVVGALLMVKSFLALQEVRRGHRTEGVLTATLSFSAGGDDDAQRVGQADRLLEELRRTPGLQLVGLTSSLPVAASYRSWAVVAHGGSQEVGDEVPATVQSIAGDYRKALDIPLLAGRDLTEAEVREGAAVALVSAGLARKLWGEADPLGRRLRSLEADPESWLTVVGVVGDVDYGRDMVSFGAVPETQVYVPYGRVPTSSLSVAVLGSLPTADMAPALRSAFRRGAPGMPFSEILTLEQAIFRERWVSGFFSRLLGLYAAVATLIAAVGLYGLTADATARRKRELAVRLALGARPRTLVAMIVAETLRLGLAGVGLGLVVAAALARFGAGMLRMVQAHDPTVFLSVGAMLLAIAVMAAALPAWRASALDPSRTLRAE